ncbi:MAG TPA: nucleotidyltransferase family protein [Vicinamibacterales bacterium]|nr:nucleotidyltransferase family protein [Vicinamibacterales bacterium]
MTGTTQAPTTTTLFAALLAGEATPWSASGMMPGEFLRLCGEHGLTGLMHERLSRLDASDWPQGIREALARDAREHTAAELLRQREMISVLDGLAVEGIHPIILKGTALAYSLYNVPASRPRIDTDLLIQREDVGKVRRVLAALDYTAPTHCDGELLFCQFPLTKTDAFGLAHTLDFHWKISTQSVFANVMGFDEIAAVANELPALGRHARTAGPLHALLLACIHPVMHHRNAESLIWTYDVHLLASRLSVREFDAFAELAIARRVSAICAHQLGRARAWLGTRVPESAMMRLAATDALEPSAAYLRPDRGWGDELMSNIRGLPRWSDRLRLLREVALPGPNYMLKAYGLAPTSSGAALLPILYVHRLSSGCWKALAGRK